MTERFVHKKSLGQHFLNNPVIPERMCVAADLMPGEVVVEIGPGTGALTQKILAHGAHVIAIETDDRAVESLTDRFKDEITNGQLTIVTADARYLNPAELGLKDRSYKVVANIPYYLSGFLFRIFLESSCQPSQLVFLVQKEVAERIVRDPKSSLLSLSIAAFGDPTYICTVKRGNFTPPPKVDSAVVAVKNISRERLSGVPAEFFFATLHLAFGQKRKQLVGNLSAAYPRAFLEQICISLEIPVTTRAEDLGLPVWQKIILALYTQKPTV